MKKELDELLCQRYPKIFVDRHGDVKQTLMCWGFECGDGWFNIIDRLCANIQHHVDWAQEQKEKYGRGEGCSQTVAVQIKEKFGTLRFYTNGGDEQIYGMIRMAESMSAVTCEECGAPGKHRSGGWIRTLCDTHETERQAKHEKYAKDNGLEL